MPESLQNILEFVIFQTNKYQITVFHLIKIAALYAITRFLLKFTRSYLKRILFSKNDIDEGRRSSIIQITKYIIYIAFFLLSLQVINIDISLLLAGSAALLVGLGFGLQHIFNDVISGIIILFESQVNSGDIIEIQGLIGKVEIVGLRTSKIVTRDNINIIVPNHKLIQDNVINWSNGNRVARFHVSVGVAYGSDTQLVSDILEECAIKHDKISNTPTPYARFINFGNSSLDFELLFWSNNIWLIEDIKSDIRFRIDNAFRKHKVTIPFPQRDIHIKTSLESLKV